eukprot:2942620-Ditylum_brightwellii.AAC.1
MYHDESTYLLLNNANIREKSVREAVKQNNAKNPPQHGQPKRELDYKRKSPCLVVMPSPKVKYILLNSNPQIIQYNIHEPPHLTKEHEVDNKDQSVTEQDTDGSDYENPDNTPQDQDQDTPPNQLSEMNINLPLPVINTME